MAEQENILTKLGKLFQNQINQTIELQVEPKQQKELIVIQVQVNQSFD